MRWLWLLLLSSCAFAQNGFFRDTALAQGGIPNAVVRVCTYSATPATPCTSLATIYSDSSLSQQALNPLTTDSKGNFQFFAFAGLFTCQVSASGYTTFSYTCQASTTTTITASGSFKNINGIRFADQFAGGSVGAKIDAACLDLAGAQGVVVVPSTMGAGNSIVGVLNNCSVWDLRLAGVGALGGRNNWSTSTFGGYGANVFTNNYWNSIYALSPNVWTNINSVELDSNILDGGINYLTSNFSQKVFYHNLYINQESHTLGQKFGLRLEGRNYGAGDSGNILANNFCWGGQYVSGDEGCIAADYFAGMGTTEYTATITSGAVTGSTSLTLNPSAGNGTQGANRFLLDSTLKSAVTITALTCGGSGPCDYTLSSNSAFGASAANTTLGNGVTVPGSPTTVTPGAMTGITTSSLLCIGDNEDFEMVIPSATTGSTFTATFAKPHQSNAIIGVGGGCGWFVETTIDNGTTAMGTTNTLHYAWPILYSTSATALKVWKTSTGGWDTGLGAWANSAPQNAGFIYPGAEVYSVQQSGTLSNTLTLSPNAVVWANTNAVIQPLYPQERVAVGHHGTQIYFPQSPVANSVGHTISLNGLPNGYTFGLQVQNQAANSFYSCTGCGGYVTPPQAPFEFEGAWQWGLKAAQFPTNGLINSGCPAGGCNQNINMQVLQFPNNAGGTEFLSYNPQTFGWTLSSGQGSSPKSFWNFTTTSFSDGQSGLFSINSSTGNGTFTTLNVGAGGSAINKMLRGSATLTYTAISAQTCQEQTLGVSGAATTGTASASPAATLGNTNLSWSAWVSSSGVVSVRVCNPSSGSITPSAVSWNAAVIQ